MGLAAVAASGRGRALSRQCQIRGQALVHAPAAAYNWLECGPPARPPARPTHMIMYTRELPYT